MTKATVALAAALLACTTLSSAAEAGGVRVGFGFPLGSFVARPHQSYSAAPSYERHCAKTQRVARHTERNEALVQKAHRAKKKVEVAEAPAPRKIKHTPKVEVAEAPAPRKIKRIPKVEVAEEAAPAPVQTAKLEDKTVASDAAPSIRIPEAPAATADVTGTQATPAPVTTATATPAATAPVEVKTATVTPEAAPVVKEAVKVEAPKAEKVEKAETSESKVKVTTSDVKRVCRRFSAAIAGLIDIPCE